MKPRGFTLVEMMVVIAIVAIIATLALPSYRNLIASNKVTAASEELYSALLFAKSEAIKRNQTVIVCQSDSPNSTAANAACSTGTDWSTGWIVFVDTNTDGAYSAANDTLLKVSTPPTGLGSIVLKTVPCAATGGGTKIAFRSFISSGGSDRVFGITVPGTATVRQVEVNNVGNITTASMLTCP